MTLALLIGSGVLSLLCFYFAFHLDENHFILRLLGFIFGLIFMFMIAVGSFTASQNCDVFVSNSTVVNDTTSYSYERQCFPETDSTNPLLLQLTGALLGLVFIYITVYVVYEVFVYKWTKQGKR